MNEAESIAYIHQLPRLAKTGKHDRILRLLAALGNPHQTGAYVHITGTNGKGSVANAVAHILEASGLTVGLFTSPYIMRFNERIMIDHQPIPAAGLIAAVAAGRHALATIRVEEPAFAVTEFEFITALAFWYFAQQGVDAAVIEVGIGGDTDSTNVITPVVSAITSVGLDHQKLLGNTLTSVATHKAGIIKPQVPVVTGHLPQAAETVIAAKVAATASPWLALDRDFFAENGRLVGWGQSFTYRDDAGRLPELELPLVGQYQLGNAAVAIATAKQFAQARDWPLSPREIRRGLAASQWPARMEKISDAPLIVLDGAHNPQGINSLIATLRRVFGSQPLTLMVGILGDKDVAGMVAALAKMPYRLWFVPVPDNPRALAVGDYPDAPNSARFASWQAALAAHMSDYADEPLVVAGSLYLVAAVRQTLLGGDQ